MNKIILATVLVILSSCAHQHRVDTSDCTSTKVNSSRLDSHEYDFSFEKTYWVRYRRKNISVLNVSEFLEQENFYCSEMESLSYIVGQEFSDVILSMIPFFSRHTIKVFGNYELSQSFLDE